MFRSRVEGNPAVSVLGATVGTEIRTALLTSIASVPLQRKEAARLVAPNVAGGIFLYCGLRSLCHGNSIITIMRPPVWD